MGHSFLCQGHTAACVFETFFVLANYSNPNVAEIEMSRSSRFHPIWGGAGQEAGYLRIIIVAVAIGMNAGATTTSSLLEGSSEASLHITDNSDNGAPRQLINETPSAPFKSMVRSHSTPASAPKGSSVGTMPQSQRSSLPEKHSALQTTINSQSTSEVYCNVATCQQLYQSFRLSDCTYQPYSGLRRYCAR